MLKAVSGVHSDEVLASRGAELKGAVKVILRAYRFRRNPRFMRGGIEVSHL